MAYGCYKFTTHWELDKTFTNDSPARAYRREFDTPIYAAKLPLPETLPVDFDDWWLGPTRKISVDKRRRNKVV